MTLFAVLLGLLLPACGAAGTGGLPPAAPIDFAALQRPATPNTALAAPAGFSPQPDLTTPTYPMPSAKLFAAAQAVAARQPRTFQQAVFADRLQAAYVVRSAVFNFPDLVTIQVVAANTGASNLIIWSRSIYGRSDLGVNRKRVAAWLAALNAALSRSSS
jgi:hypothetical protein